MTFLRTIVILLFLVVGVQAQNAEVADLQQTTSTGTGLAGVQPSYSPFSLLSSEKITWSHSYSVSFFSGGSSSGSVGLMSSTMHYQFSPKLSLAVNLGVLHNPSALWGSGEDQASFLPGFRLDYRPSDKVSMSVSFQRYDGYYSPYTGFRRVRSVSPFDW